MDRIFLYKQGKLLAKLSKYLVEISQTYEILVVCLSLKVAIFANTIKNTPILNLMLTQRRRRRKGDVIVNVQ